MDKNNLQGIKRGLHLQPLNTAKFIVTDGGDDKARGGFFFREGKREPKAGPRRKQ